MKYLLLLLIPLGVIISVGAREMDLVTFSDLRLREKNEQRETPWGIWYPLSGKSGQYIRFESDQISGSDGCNRFSASLMVAGESLQVGQLLSTRAHCEDLAGSDDVFRVMIQRIVRYELTESGYLRFFDSSGEVLHEFQRTHSTE